DRPTEWQRGKAWRDHAEIGRQDRESEKRQHAVLDEDVVEGNPRTIVRAHEDEVQGRRETNELQELVADPRFWAQQRTDGDQQDRKGQYHNDGPSVAAVLRIAPGRLRFRSGRDAVGDGDPPQHEIDRHERARDLPGPWWRGALYGDK